MAAIRSGPATPLKKVVAFSAASSPPGASPFNPHRRRHSTGSIHDSLADVTLGQAAAWSAAEAILARRASWADTPERLRRGDKDDDDDDSDDDDEWEDDDEDLAI